MGRDGDGVTVRDGSIRISFTWPVGKPRRETFKVDGVVQLPTAVNVKVARRLAKDVRAAIKAGTFEYATFFPDSKHAPLAGSLTFGKACEQYLESKGQLATKTKDQYRNALEVWKGMFGAATPIRSIKHGAMAAKIGSHAWASPKLLNNYLICLRGVFRLAGRDIKLDDPTDGIENVQHQKPPPDPLSDEERDRVLAHMHKHCDPRVWAYFAFAFATGLRPEEQIALRWGDIDWQHGTARIERARVAGETKAIKTYQVRDIELTRRALEALKTMKPHTFMKKEPDVFMNPVTGRPWHDERSQRDHYWSPVLKRLGIRHRRAYNTRHTYATSALMGGVNPAYISRQMGHRSAKMLFSTYAKWIDAADRGRELGKLDAAQNAAADALLGGGIAQESP
jgi:integrase